jgi:hypothetical protein
MVYSVELPFSFEGLWIWIVGAAAWMEKGDEGSASSLTVAWSAASAVNERMVLLVERD